MLDSIFEPGVTGVSPFAIMLSLYLNHNNPRALLWAFATFMAWIIFLPLYWYKNMRGRKS